MVDASSLSLGVLYPQVPAFRHNQEDGKSQCWTGMVGECMVSKL
jgi:hypothetical protein